MKIQLNIFTNSTGYAPNTEIIVKTFKSFVDCFGNIPVNVFLDKKPNELQAVKYRMNLQKIFPEVIEMDSLSDGYIKAIKSSSADYLFMLEHDWQFRSDLIKHSLNEICTTMEQNDIYHFRFNKRKNSIAGWDEYIYHSNFMHFDYCISNNMSNNPHIIDRKRYENEIMKYIKIKPGSKGIEEELNKTGKFESCIYGGFNYPATVIHSDGRRCDKKINKKAVFRV